MMKRKALEEMRAQSRYVNVFARPEIMVSNEGLTNKSCVSNVSEEAMRGIE